MSDEDSVTPTNPEPEALQAPNLLRCLINCSEKACNIARLCRSNEQLLKLLVQEKSADEANPRFQHDFKTLADVFIQQVVKHDVGNSFPAMRDAIKGEETPNFTNSKGEKTEIIVGSPEETATCLAAVLQDELYLEAASALAKEAHQNVVYGDAESLGKVPAYLGNLNYEDLGIWIDPIDATAEYITGDSIFTDFPGITSTGLDCVTVLIGVYERSTGVPIAGVVSQPFHKKISTNNYQSCIFWGICTEGLKAHNCSFPDNAKNRSDLLAIFSSSEQADILDKVSQAGYSFAFSAGAGHKALKVITSEVDMYLLSKGSTFKWDTCAPQAILRAMGGNIFDFKASVREQAAVPLDYREPSGGESEEESAKFNCNAGGLIALRDADKLGDILGKFRE